MHRVAPTITTSTPQSAAEQPSADAAACSGSPPETMRPTGVVRTLSSSVPLCAVERVAVPACYHARFGGFLRARGERPTICRLSLAAPEQTGGESAPAMVVGGVSESRLIGAPERQSSLLGRFSVRWRRVVRRGRASGLGREVLVAV